MTVSNPGERRVKGRRKGLQGIWSSKEWKEQKALFLAKHPVCAMCGKESTVPHHPNMSSYKGYYTDLELSQCVAYCQRCHFAVHHGMRLCDQCGEHYHHWDAEECHWCFDKGHPEIVAAREEYVRKKEQAAREAKKEKNKKLKAARDKDKCKHRRANGVCKLSLINSQCIKCDSYEKKD